MTELTTGDRLASWLEALRRNDGAAVAAGLADDVEFVTPRDRSDAVVPYLGTHRGKPAVLKAFEVRAGLVETVSMELHGSGAAGQDGWSEMTTRERLRSTGQEFDVHSAHLFHFAVDARIDRWRSYVDPAPDVRAFAPTLGPALVAAVDADDAAEVDRLLGVGADPDARHPNGLTVLMVAAGHGRAAVVERLLRAGADPLAVDSGSGTPVFNKACQGGSLEVVKLLLAAGCFPESVSTTTGHTPLMDAVWFSRDDVVEYLLGLGVGLNAVAHYGFTLDHHMDFERNVNKGKNAAFDRMDAAIAARRARDAAKAGQQKLLAAVAAGDLAEVKRLIAVGEPVDERAPITNTFNDDHTPLLVAARDGHTEIVAALLEAGADGNAMEPTFCAVPLHKAVYNGYTDITRLLAAQPGVDLNVQGATNGYTPLHDSLWHGFEDCAAVLLDAGARVDLHGHDGRTPLEVARVHLPAESGVVRRLEELGAKSGKTD